MERVFLSYSFRDLVFVSCVADLLRRQQLPHYFHTFQYETGRVHDEIHEALRTCTGFVFFRGEKLGAMQQEEVAASLYLETIGRREWVRLSRRAEAHPVADKFCNELMPIRLHEPAIELSPQTEAFVCATEIARRFFPGHRWSSAFNLPDTYVFDYEKDIIDRYAAGGGILDRAAGENHCPVVWPGIPKRPEHGIDDQPLYTRNPLPMSAVGTFRTDRDVIVVDARAKNLFATHSAGARRAASDESAASGCTVPLTFPEAGPRESVCFPVAGRSRQLNVGILVSGGIAPGINAVVRGIVNRHALYARPPAEGEVVADRSRDRVNHDLNVFGITSGLRGLLTEGFGARRLLRRVNRNEHEDYTEREIVEQAQAGGSILRTSRADELLSGGTTDALDRIISRLTDEGERLDILYLIGGDGSMRAAHALQQRANELDRRLSIVAVPKTMDNDVLWVWQSFGFLSAVERAREAISHLYVEARSNPRVCVLQLFGSDSGFVASHAALASGVCDYVLVPEVRFSMTTVIERVIEKLESRHSKGAYSMIVMAETAIPRDFEEYVGLPEVGLSGYPDGAYETDTEYGALKSFVAHGGRVRGQTPDALRSAALKLVAGSIAAGVRRHGRRLDDPYWKRFRVFSNEPRHLIRAIPPSSADVIFGERLGALAVDAAMAGYSDCMVSQWLTEFVLVPLSLVVLGRKRVPPRGFFWRSVLASTGQPDEHERLRD